jgi:hypothetical protein
LVSNNNIAGSVARLAAVTQRREEMAVTKRREEMEVGAYGTDRPVPRNSGPPEGRHHRAAAALRPCTSYAQPCMQDGEAPRPLKTGSAVRRRLT